MITIETRHFDTFTPGSFEPEKASATVSHPSAFRTVQSPELSGPDTLPDLLRFFRANLGSPQTLEECSQNQKVILVYLNNVLPRERAPSPVELHLNFEINQDPHKYQATLKGTWNPNKPKLRVSEMSCELEALIRKTVITTRTQALTPGWVAWDNAKFYQKKDIAAAHDEVVPAFGFSSLTNFTTWNSRSCIIKEYNAKGIGIYNLKLTPPPPAGVIIPEPERLIVRPRARSLEINSQKKAEEPRTRCNSDGKPPLHSKSKAKKVQFSNS